MNPRLLVAVVIAAFAVAVGVVAVAGQSLIGELSSSGLVPRGEAGAMPIEIQLGTISIQEVDNRFATVDIAFTVTNPNTQPVLLPLVSYRVYESGVQVYMGAIGERLDAIVVGSNYVTLLSGQTVTLEDSFTLRNTGNAPDLWDALVADAAEWSVTGEAVYALSSVTAGGQNEITFEFP